jgi:chemotaxis protein methyltransferase CheR
MSNDDFNRVCKMIYERAGIVLDGNKKEMVYGRVSKRLRLHGFTEFTPYLDRLTAQPNAREWESFVNALTTNLTAFFREEHHFPLLAKHVAGRTSPVRIWCAAASTGEEPYSIAMTLIETLGASLAAQCRIIATDIDTEALGKASAGIYPIKQVTDIGDERAKRFFLKGSMDNSGFARVKPELSSMIEFRQLNLNAPSWDIKGKFDAIFCRNIMIYFDRVSQARILKGFAPLMQDDGLLITGHSENFTYLESDFKLRGQTIYTLNKASAKIA